MLIETRDGRVIKLEGNPAHPLNRGALCARGQAAPQGLYNPDRYREPMVREGREARAHDVGRGAPFCWRRNWVTSGATTRPRARRS